MPIITLALAAIFAISVIGTLVTLLVKNGAIAALIRGDVGNQSRLFLIFFALAFVSLISLMVIGDF